MKRIIALIVVIAAVFVGIRYNKYFSPQKTEMVQVSSVEESANRGNGFVTYARETTKNVTEGIAKFLLSAISR